MTFGKSKLPTWTCPEDKRKGTHRVRMVQHAVDHWEACSGTRKAIWWRMIILEDPSMENADEIGEMASKSKRIKSSGGQRTMKEYCVNDSAKQGCEALARYVIETATPLSICENPAMRDMLSVFMSIGQSAGHNNVRIDVDDILTSRELFTETVDKVAVDDFARHTASISEEARDYGCTLIQDGRNVRNDPLITSGVQGRSAFVTLGSVNADAAKKDADYIFKLVEDHLDDGLKGSGFGSCIIAIVLDGAAANIKAMRKVNSALNLLVVRCQAHALALLIKKILLTSFGDTIKKADRLITFIRNHSRVYSLLKSISGNLAVLRFIETRFNTHPVALARLLQLRSALSTMVGDERYCAYIEEARNIMASEINAIIADAKFWEETKLALEICMPITIALRRMDKSTLRTRHVHKVWSSLAGHTVQVLQHDCWKRIPLERKREIFRIYHTSWIDAHYPIMSAAYVLDPSNYDDVHRMAQNAMAGDDEDGWSQYYKDTLDCLRTLIKRLYKTKVQEKVTAAERDMAKFIGRTENFAGARFTEEDTIETWWVSRFCLLGKLALMILNVVCSVSNIERLHKVYSSVQIKQGNQLLDQRMDRLVKANFLLRMNRMQKTDEMKSVGEILGHLRPTGSSVDDKSILAFTNLTPEVEADLESWMSLYVQSDAQISRALRTATASSDMATSSSSIDNVLTVTTCDDVAARDGAGDEADAEEENEEEVIYDVDTGENETVDASVEGRRVPKAPKIEGFDL